MKRKLTLFLSAVMVASSLPVTASAANFKDINDVAWASDVISNVADRGLLSGYNDGTFRGKNNVTYCEAMQMVYTTLTKSGVVAPMDAVTVYSYMQSLDALKVPQWAQMAVAYGLSTGILDMQMVATKFSGGTAVATREDVAVIFGNAMGYVFGKERDTSGAKSFVDYWSINVNALEQVSLLKKMGIIKGDTYNRFNPKSNINRAEMAVMMNNTFELLVEGTSYSGEIIVLDSNKGADGTVYYYIQIETEDGRKEGFSVTDGAIPVYDGNSSQTVAMSKLSKGDDVVFMISGTELVAIRQMEGTTDQEKYDITGYVHSIKDNTLSLENENTGKTTRYSLGAGVKIYVDGEAVKRNELEKIMKERYKDFAYAGVNTEVKREKVDGTYKNVTHIKELYITFIQEYSVVGTVEKFQPTSISIKLEHSSGQKQFTLAADCEFYIADEKVSYDEMKELQTGGTVYAKVMVNAQDQATAITMSEDTFASPKELEESKTYKLGTLTDYKLVLEDKGEKIIYNFDSTNPVDNIDFYTWDAKDESFDTVKLEKAEEYVDADTYEDENGTKTVTETYCKITFTSSGKLSEVYLSHVKNAWKNSEEHQTERKGTVASVEEDVLKFKTSSVEYTFLKSYDSSKLKNLSGLTDSKSLLAKMANDDAMELHAELTANGNNEIIKIETVLKSAEGKLVEFNRDEKYIKIKTADGNEFKLPSQKNPKLTDEVEDKFELDDLDGETSKYIGEKVILGFAASGPVNRITVGNGPKEAISGVITVKGIAVGTEKGLEMEDGEVYRWMGKTSDISITNYSTANESFETIKRLINDPDVEVYVEATLEQAKKGDNVVDKMKIYVRSAEGELTAYDDTVKIKTDSGNTFAFYTKAKLDTCNVDGYGQEDLKERDKGIGSYVKLTFGSNGSVCGIEG